MGAEVNAMSEEALLWSASRALKADSFLIQQRLKPRELGDHVGRFRLFHIRRKVIPGWWNPYNHEYQMLTPGEIKQYHLGPLRRTMPGLARISQMKKFTSEICLHQVGKFYAAD